MYSRTIVTMLALGLGLAMHAQVSNPGQVARDATTNHANNDMSNAADKGASKAEQGVTNLFKKKNKDKKQDSTSANSSTAVATDAASNGGQSQAPGQATSIKVYQNYDFIPGEKILFDDNFLDDRDGEFPAHWKLLKGQAVINKVDGRNSFLLTEGNYAVVAPRMKTDKYLTGDFTLEFDYIFKPGTDGGIGSGPGIEFYYLDENGNEASKRVAFEHADVEIDQFSKEVPEALLNTDKWHHAAVIKKQGQMKAYVDQYRLVVNPNADQKFYRLEIDGIGTDATPIVFSNVKLAEGGGMNVIGQKFTDSKIVTHGINFDVDRATIKPESMGTLNMIVQVLKENPSISFEIDGHTDNSGAAAHNLTLSQQRADAVKSQLVSMGIDGSRLSTRGFGDTHPLSDNGTPEGKANNRRVEFIKH